MDSAADVVPRVHAKQLRILPASDASIDEQWDALVTLETTIRTARDPDVWCGLTLTACTTRAASCEVLMVCRLH